MSVSKLRYAVRRNFGSIEDIIPISDLVSLQKTSFTRFLGVSSLRAFSGAVCSESGLVHAYQSIFPVENFSENLRLEFVSAFFDLPKLSVDESRIKGVTYCAALKVVFRLIVFEEVEGTRVIRDIKEQEVYMGDIPLMTSTGSFIINGVERVIVSQVHRSPGVFFDYEKVRTGQTVSGSSSFVASIIPYRGSWIDFHFDTRELMFLRVDRKKKLLASTFLLALGMSVDDILAAFYTSTRVFYCDGVWQYDFEEDKFLGLKTKNDLIDFKTQQVIWPAGKKITAGVLKKINSQISEEKKLLLPLDCLIGCYFAKDIIDLSSGLLLIEAGQEVSADLLSDLLNRGIDNIDILDIDHFQVGAYMRHTVVADKNFSTSSALFDIYRMLYPGEIPSYDAAKSLLQTLFFDNERYDLSAVGRVKMNMRLGLDCDDDITVLRIEDILEVLRILHKLRDGKGDVDDIDHLGNRRVRAVGELLENQYRIGLLRMERSIREKMSSSDLTSVMPQDLLNVRSLSAILRDFFSSSQLSQFMDQTNPLSEITHKRRLSALGPGGLSRDRAGFEVRDVHPTHYGRLCPVETPEGPNIGLINSLATYAFVNKYGFIETPYRKVVNGVATEEVIYLSALEEMRYAIAQANSPLDSKGNFIADFVQCRRGGDQLLEHAVNVDFMDVSPKQIVSVAASLIPFLENDDANRALMGANMQRQAVPLLSTQAPLVGTGMEWIVARDSGALVVAACSGVVDYVDSNRVVVRHSNDDIGGVDIYRLRKYQRSNQNTCINQRPIVSVGDFVHQGDVLADGAATQFGELALGKNVLVAFMPWNGYNFEDSILLSERVVRNDIFTSVHIEEFEIAVRDTKLGAEEVTRDIPHVGEDVLCNLDETGIICVGARVSPGDILVGKITPKSESVMTPEEKLLRAIFGEKASDVRDTSLRMPAGVSGTVVDVRVFNRRGLKKDQRSLQIEHQEIRLYEQDRDDELRLLSRGVILSLSEILDNTVLLRDIATLKAGSVLEAKDLERMTVSQLSEIVIDNQEKMDLLSRTIQMYKKQSDHVRAAFSERVERSQRGDDLSPGVMKVIKVFVAVKRKIQPGDKMAGRHGNKGVVSRIVAIEDMPFLPDGTHVDMVLNPLGVPSRMNVGQILETHLGWAVAQLGKKLAQLADAAVSDDDIAKIRAMLQEFYGDAVYYSLFQDMDNKALQKLLLELIDGIPVATPVFDGVSEKKLESLLETSGENIDGQRLLYDGRTGEAFERPVTVGYIYMLKLHHLVDDKIHARSTGPYSLVTQQPLGGKAQFGGQRLGEMEVWALQAYGASHTLQEMLTVKSDDVEGRAKVYESLVRGNSDFTAGVPESFNVLVKEMRSLCLNVELLEEPTVSDFSN